MEIILCPYCQTQFFSNDIIKPHRVVLQVLARFRINCPHDGCQEQIGYDQHDAHIDQCQFNSITCEHCSHDYQRIDQCNHEAKCLDLIKFKNLELSEKLAESIAEVENGRSELQSTISELVSAKRTISEERQKSGTELTKVRSELKLVRSQLEINKRTSSEERKISEDELTKLRSELDLVKSQLGNHKRTSAEERENCEAKLAKARAALESIKSQFQNVTVLPAGFKYFANDVFAMQLKQATTTSFDSSGRDLGDTFDYFQSYSAKEQFTGAMIYVTHEHEVYSEKTEDWIFLVIEREESTKLIKAEWNTKIWQKGKKLLDKDYKYTFEKDTGWGPKVKKNCDQVEFFVMVTIKKWNIAKYKTILQH